MQDRNKNRFSLPMVAAITGAVLAAGVGVAWWAKSTFDEDAITSQPNPAPIVESEIPATPEPITQKKVVQIWWLNPTGDKIELVSKTMTFQKSVKSERVMETALETLFSQPPEDSPYTTSIPQGTKLLDATTKKDGVHLNLSQEFVSGGGSTSMTSRLAQVIYTATSAKAVDNVWISVEGQPLDNLGGEGLIISQPMTRDDFDDNFTL